VRRQGVSGSVRPKLTKHQQAEALARVAQGETLTEIAKRLCWDAPKKAPGDAAQKRELQRLSHDDQSVGGVSRGSCRPNLVLFIVVPACGSQRRSANGALAISNTVT
jgi:hypothetical protein